MKVELTIVCYVDADRAGDLRNRRATSGWVGALHLSSRKQVSVALLPTKAKAKYLSAAYASQEVMWLQ